MNAVAGPTGLSVTGWPATRGRVETVVLAALAAGLAAWAMTDALLQSWGGAPLPVRLLAALGTTLPLAALRRAPEVVVGLVTAAALLVAVGWPSSDDPPVLAIGLLVAAFGLGAFAARRRPFLWAAYGVLAVGATLTSPDERTAGDVVWIVGTWCMVLAVGVLVSEREATERGHVAVAARTRDAAPAAASEALAHERARIARDLHDIVTRSVSTMVDHAHAGRAASVAGRLDDAASELSGVEATGQAALAELRRMLDVMRGSVDHPATPQPGLDALDQLLGRSVAAGSPTQVRLHGDLVRVPPGVGVAAYRVVEEALDEVHRSATGAAVDVDVTAGREDLTISVHDTGPITARPSSTLEDRVSLYGGRLTVGPDRHRSGWRVEVVLPI